MSRTDRHKKVTRLEDYDEGRRSWNWWVTVGRKHCERMGWDKAYFQEKNRIKYLEDKWRKYYGE